MIVAGVAITLDNPVFCSPNMAIPTERVGRQCDLLQPIGFLLILHRLDV